MAEPLKVVLYSCPKADAPPMYFPMSRHDATALKIQAPITLAYHFREALDPQRLSQSLFLLLERFPAFGGCLVAVDDVLHVRSGIHDAEVQAVEVPANLVACPQYWVDIMDELPLRRAGAAGGRFYQVVLLHSGDPTDGCTLLATFDHGLADACTCGVLMATWSDLHKTMPLGPQQEEGAEPTPASPPTPPAATPMALPPDFELACAVPDLHVRRFHFHPNHFAHLKEAISGESSMAVSTNDILLAICVCTVARYEPRVGDHATISTMVDARGRGLRPDLLGNGARALMLPVAWDVALSRNLTTVSVAVHRALAEALEALPARCEKPEFATTHQPTLAQPTEPAPNADGPSPGPAAAAETPTEIDVRSEPDSDDPALFYFNSWARLQSLVQADFGAGLARFEWVPLRTLQRKRSFVVVPATADGGLALQACLPQEEMEYFCQLWETFKAAQGA